MRKSILSFTAMLLVISLFGVICFTGLDFGFFAIPPVTDTDDGIRLGLDLVGGSIITFEAMVEEEMDADTLDNNMNIVESMLRSRLDQLELFEATIYRVGEKRITVEIPSITNPEEAVQKLGSTAKLEFKNADGEVVLEGKEVAKSEALNGAIDQTQILQNFVKLTLNSEATAKFAEATKIAANAGSEKNYIDIQLDGETISAPRVSADYKSTGITGGTVLITGGFTPEDASWLANVIAAGQLPFALEEVELRSVGAQLGVQALETSIMAGAIGIALVILFMIAVYRLPGVVASISLMFYTVIVLNCLSLFKVNLSLPGIAGIILSIGMAVDANVVIFERIKEELKVGKTIKASIDSGFDRAFGAIFDSNVTTLIAAVVLYFFGTGTIKGFALTLGLGIVVSMFTALTVTHFLLNRMVDFRLTNLAFYGISVKADKEKKQLGIANKFKVYGLISIVLVAAGLAGLVTAPFGVNMFNLDIDFAGGTTMYYDMGQKVTGDVIAEIEKAFKDATGYETSAVQSTGDGNEVMVKAVNIDTEKREAFTEVLKERFGISDSSVLNVEDVSPAIGKDLQKSAFKSAGIAACLMLLYITVRFDFVSGISAVICLIHDVLVMISLYVVFKLPLNLNFIAAALIIFGYSINASIITFDRIRENMKSGKKATLVEIVNESINQTLTRNINTTITTLCTIVLVYILGVQSLKNFSLPIIAGVLSGAYSSIFIAGSLWAKIKGMTTKD